jgi:hypothetical protein
MYTTGVASGKSAPASRPPDASPGTTSNHPDSNNRSARISYVEFAHTGTDNSPKPPQEFTGEQAKNAILYSFRDFYLVSDLLERCLSITDVLLN